MQSRNEATIVVVFRVGREEYAVPIGSVREVVTWTEPTAIPDAPALVEGVVNLRGEIIPVLDVAKLFRTERTRATADARIMVMDVASQQAGFIVDDVTEVKEVDERQLVVPSSVLWGSRIAASVVSGILKLDTNRLVVLVDPVRILASSQIELVAVAKDV